MGDPQVHGVTFPAIKPGRYSDVMVTAGRQSPVRLNATYPIEPFAVAGAVPAEAWGLIATGRTQTGLPQVVGEALSQIAGEEPVHSLARTLREADATGSVIVRVRMGSVSVARAGLSRVLTFREGELVSQSDSPASESFDVDPRHITCLVALSAACLDSAPARDVSIDAVQRAVATTQTPGDLSIRLGELYQAATIEHDLSLLIVCPHDGSAQSLQLAAHVALPEDRERIELAEPDDSTPTTAL